jgi:hypothetical protein
MWSAFKFKPKARLNRKCRMWLNVGSYIYIVWAEGETGSDIGRIESLLEKYLLSFDAAGASHYTQVAQGNT